MRPLRGAARSWCWAVGLLGLGFALAGCFKPNLGATYLLQPQQRQLVKDMMKGLETGQEQLEQSLDGNRWDAIVRIAEEMAGNAQRLHRIQTRKEAEDFRIRAAELEHDLLLLAREARLENQEAVEEQLQNLDFTCESCHRKFQRGRPW